MVKRYRFIAQTQTDGEVDRVFDSAEVVNAFDYDALNHEMLGRLGDAGARIAALASALRWYADESNYGTRVCNDGDGHFDVMESNAEEDRGARARACFSVETK